MGVGAAAGLHVATWGMFKDCLFEGFSWGKYARSVILGLVLAVVVQRLNPLPFSPAGVLLLFGLTYALERGVTEWSKGFLRREDQSKYFIPMQFAVLGRPVRSRGLRLLVGVGYAGAVVLSVIAVRRLGATFHQGAWLAGCAVAAAVAGISAVGGAWKDAPLEGFQLLKFFRSPAVGGFWGLVLSLLSGDLVAVSFGALGLTIATIETWKKFHQPHSAPGKFTGKTVRFPELRRWRRRFVPVMISVWALVLGAATLALAAW
jgi:hypothetical protein